MQCLPLHSDAMNQNRMKYKVIQNGYFLQFDELLSPRLSIFC